MSLMGPCGSITGWDHTNVLPKPAKLLLSCRICWHRLFAGCGGDYLGCSDPNLLDPDYALV